MFSQSARGPRVYIADEADFQWNSFIQNILCEVAQLHYLSVGHGDVIDEPGSMSNAVSAAILDSLPDVFLSEAFAGVNGDIEILALNIVKSIHVLLGRISTFLARQIEPDHATLAKVDGQFRHFERDVHIAHGADDQAGRDAEIFSAALQAFQHRGHNLLVTQPFAGMKYRCKARLEINNSILA